MIWFIIGFVLMIMCLYNIYADDYNDWVFKIFCTLGIPFITLLSVVAINIFFSIFIVESDKTIELSSEKEIYSLKDNLSTSGSFFLGTGNINTELKYYYMVKEDLGYKVESISMENTNIKETSSTPKIKIYGKTCRKLICDLFAMNYDERYVLEVPKDTIKITYSIDME